MDKPVMGSSDDTETVHSLIAERDRALEGQEQALLAEARSQAEWRRLGAENQQLREEYADLKRNFDTLMKIATRTRVALRDIEEGREPSE